MSRGRILSAVLSVAILMATMPVNSFAEETVPIMEQTKMPEETISPAQLTENVGYAAQDNESSVISVYSENNAEIKPSFEESEPPITLFSGPEIIEKPTPEIMLNFNAEIGQITGYTGMGDTLVIPESIDGVAVVSIISYAFSDLSLTSVTIPSSVINIGRKAFGSVEKIIGYSNSYAETYASNNGITFESVGYAIDGGALSFDVETGYITGYTGTPQNPVIPQQINGVDVLGINTNAFKDCSSIVSLDFPQTMIEIQYNAFENCSNLTQVTVHNGEMYMGGFYNCPNLTKFIVAEGVTSINNALCISQITDSNWESVITEVVLPSTLKSIGDSTFSNCTGLTAIELPSELETLESYSFQGCSSITDIVLPQSITSVGTNIFNGCSNLTEKIFENFPLGFAVITQGTFSGCTNLKNVVIPNNIISIEASAFRDCTGITDLTINQGLSDIGNYSFAGNIGLTAVEFPSSVNNISSYAFQYCSNLAEVIVHNGEANFNGAFTDCDNLTKMTVADGVETMAYSLGLRSISNLSEVSLPSTLKTIGDSTFINCKKLAGLTIPSGVETIRSNAFYGCTLFTDIVLPQSLTSLGSDVFNGCSNLTEKIFETFPLSITAIPHGTFSGCTNLKNVVIPNNIISIEASAFRDCTGITDLTINQGLSDIGNYSFAGNIGLTAVEFPSSVNNISSYAFQGCSNLAEVIVHNGEANLNGAFTDCDNLTKMTVADGVETMAYSLGLSSVSNLEKLYIPRSVTNIDINNIPYEYITTEGESVKTYTATIYCYKNSYAHSFAIENSIPFVLINEEIVSISALEDIHVAYNEEHASALPDVVTATLDSGEAVEVSVTWTLAEQTGSTYSYTGIVTIEDGSGIANSAGISASVNVVVDPMPIRVITSVDELGTFDFEYNADYQTIEEGLPAEIVVNLTSGDTLMSVKLPVTWSLPEQFAPGKTYEIQGLLTISEDDNITNPNNIVPIITIALENPPERVIDHITAAPVKTNYAYGEEFSANGEITVVYTNEYYPSETVSFEDAEITGYNPAISGEQTITVTYGTATVTYTVTVAAPPIVTHSVTFIANKTEVAVKTVNHGQALTDIPTVPEIPGYTGEWSVTDFSEILEDMTVNAVYRAIVYAITSINEAETISVEFGTDVSSIIFPEEVTAVLNYKETISLPVTWSCEEYDKNTSGVYSFTGIIELAENIINKKNLTAKVNVVVAENTAAPIGISISNVTAGAGEEFSAAIAIMPETDIAAGSFIINYDSTKLTPLGYSFESDYATQLVKLDYDYNKIKVSFASAENVSVASTILKINFKVADDAQDDTFADMELESVKCYDETMVLLPLVPTNGRLHILNYTLGDVNKDNSIDIMDSFIIVRYGVELLTLSASQLKAADVNMDGAVNIFDAVAIQKFDLGLVSELK